jgi:multiple sugar transport system permease protein/sn-glycerol 3-phosphate transport system permease protein
MCTGLAFPFYWMLATSLKPVGDSPGAWLPSVLYLGNYRAVLDAIPLARMYFNSVITSVIAATLQVGLALPMAYAFARLSLPGKRPLFILVLSTLFVPDEMKLIPNFLLVNDLHWSDTYAALVLPVAAHAFPVFVLHEHIRRIPRDHFEAGAMDGASHLRTLHTIVLPQSGGVLVALWMVALVGRWNDYLWPLVVVESSEMQTLTVGLASMKNAESAGVEWGPLMAGAALAALPLAFVFAVFQRYLVMAVPSEHRGVTR